MGIEQIIMPLLGGVAKGMTEGFEVKRKEKIRQQEQKDSALIQMIQKDPSVLDIPEIAAGAERIYGKNEVRAWAKAQRIKNAYENYYTQELMQKNVPMSQGEFETQQPLETQIPGLPPNTPGTAVDITGQGGGGGGNPIMGLLSKVLPAIGGQAAGQAPQGAPSLPSLPSATQSTGAPSGPQVPPAAMKAAPSKAPQAAGPKIVGRMPSGRPIVDNGDGTFSSHRNMIAGFGDKFYIVPTIYQGKQVSADQAAQIARQNRLTDPDTGEPLQGFASQQEAEQAEQAQHGELERQMQESLGMVPSGSDQAIAQAAVDKGLDARVVGGPALTPTPAASGGTPPQRILVQSAQQAAFTPKKKKMQLGEGVTVTKRMKNGLSITVTNDDPKWMTPEMAIGYRFLQDAGMEGDYTDPQNFQRIYRMGQTIKQREQRASAYQAAKGKEEVEHDPLVMAAEVALEGMKTGARKRAELAEDIVKGEVRKTGLEEQERVRENYITKNTKIEIPGQEVPLSPNEQEVQQAADSARAVTLAKPPEAIQQDRLRRGKKMFRLGEQAQKIYAEVGSEAIHRFWATEKSVEWRKYWGTLTPGEQRLHSVIQDIYNESIKDLSGAGVPVAEAPRLIGPLPNMAVGDPALFVDELQRFLANAEDAVNTQIELARTPVGELQGVGKSAPAPLPKARSSAAPPTRRNPPVIPRAPLGTGPTQMPGSAPVAPLDNTATSAPPEVVPIPAGMFKETPTPEEMASGNFAHKLTPKGLKALSDAAKRGDLRKGSVYEYAPQ